MSVVLRTPPTTAHAVTEAINHFLEEDVEFDVGSQGPVAGLVHQPAAAALEHAEDEESGNGITDGNEIQTSEEENGDLSEAVSGVEGGPVEPALSLEAAGHLDEVLSHGFVSAESVGFFSSADLLWGSSAARESSEHLLGLGGAEMELFEGISSVTALGEELENGATGVTESVHVIQVAVNENFILATWSTSSGNWRRGLLFGTHFYLFLKRKDRFF